MMTMMRHLLNPPAVPNGVDMDIRAAATAVLLFGSNEHLLHAADDKQFDVVIND